MNTPRNIFLICLLFFVTVSLCGQEMTRMPIGEVPDPATDEQSEQEYKDSIKTEFLKKKFIEYNNNIDKLREQVFDIDTLKLSRQTVKELVDDYKVELDKLNSDFTDVKGMSGTIIDEELISWKESFSKHQAEINKRFNVLQKWIDNQKPPINWLVILGVVLGVIVVFAMTVMPVLMKKSADKNQKKAMKEAEWQTLTIQLQQIPQSLEPAHSPLIESLLSQYTNFIEKPPKKLYKEEALAKIKMLRLKKLQIGTKISIPDKEI